jgi:copper resistance protein B
MKKSILSMMCALSLIPGFSHAAGMGADDPLLTYFQADKLEWRDTREGNLMLWELNAWIGRDLNKFWIKSSGEKLKNEVESNQIDLLYSKAISAFWDLQVGVRHEFKPEPSEDWIGFGFMGTAPYMVDVDAHVFINSDSLVNARLSMETEYMFTRKIVMKPNLELKLNSDDDNARGIVSGLSSAELGVRLHYEIKREFSPYIGINFEKKFGNNIVKETSETQVLAGLSFWF